MTSNSIALTRGRIIGKQWKRPDRLGMLERKLLFYRTAVATHCDRSHQKVAFRQESAFRRSIFNSLAEPAIRCGTAAPGSPAALRAQRIAFLTGSQSLFI